MKTLVLVVAVLSSTVSIARADEAADGKAFTTFFDKLADTVVADKGACPKMGTDMNTLIDANADVVKKAKEAHDSGKQMPKDVQQHVQATARKMMPAIGPCMKDPGVKSAMDKLPHGGPHK